MLRDVHGVSLRAKYGKSTLIEGGKGASNMNVYLGDVFSYDVMYQF